MTKMSTTGMVPHLLKDTLLKILKSLQPLLGLWELNPQHLDLIIWKDSTFHYEIKIIPYIHLFNRGSCPSLNIVSVKSLSWKTWLYSICGKTANKMPHGPLEQSPYELLREQCFPVPNTTQTYLWHEWHTKDSFNLTDRVKILTWNDL